jgi:hypothetical protein
MISIHRSAVADDRLDSYGPRLVLGADTDDTDNEVASLDM